VARWFAAESDTLAVGVIGGEVSGHLEIIDFDDSTCFPIWIDVVKSQAPDLPKRLVAERSLRGGMHVFYRCESPVQGNLKLARGVRTDDSGRDVTKTLIETRGEGGYVVASPSKGYRMVYGAIDQVQTLTIVERNLLLQAARSLDEIANQYPEPEPPRAPGALPSDDRPGDAFNADYSMFRRLLESHGWQPAHRHGDVEYWRRPGKASGGISATWNHIPGRFHVFSSNAAPLDSEKTYSPFAVYAIIECNGDFSEAGRRLRSIGYGMRDPLAPTPRGEPPTPEPVGPVRGHLAIVPDSPPEPEQRRITRDDPDWEPGMDDPDDDPLPQPNPLPDASADNVVPMRTPLIGMPQHILDATVIQHALAGERGLGALAALLFRDRLLYDHASCVWYRWGGHHWIECRCGEELAELKLLQMLIQSTATRKRPSQLPRPDRERTKDKDDRQKNSALFDSLLAAADSLKKLVVSRHILEFAASGEDGIGIAGDEWDQNAQYMLAVKNGVVDLRTGELRAGHPSDRLRMVAPTVYDPLAKCPRWEQFISEIMPSDEVARFLKRLLGYAITGSVSEHVFPVLWGETGRNGKDTLIEAIHSVLGGVATPIAAKTLMAQSYQPDHDSAMLDLRGRRLVWGSESGDRQRLDAQKIKLWTGGGTLKGRAPYGAHQVAWAPTHKLFLISNYKPKVSADDQAMWRRMVLIPFQVTFKDHPNGANQKPIDRELGAKLKSEQSGILRWLVEGCIEWQEKGLQIPRDVQLATADYRNEEDMVGQFIADNLAAQEDSQVLGKELYERYCKWCDLNAQGRPIGAKAFAKVMKNKNFQTRHSRAGAVYLGVKLVDPDVTA